MAGKKTLDSKKFVTKMNEYKQRMAEISEGVQIRNPWRPLKVAAHPRQAEMDQYRAMPSQYA